MRTQQFSSVAAFIVHLAAAQVAVRARAQHALDQALVIIEQDCRGQVGYYQTDVGPFPAWAPLAAATEDEKARLGAPSGAPLLRHGQLHASFQHERAGDEGVAGSTDPTMVYHEFGTSKMPPRPVVGPAFERNRDRLLRLLGHAVVEGMIDGQVLPGGKGYFGGDL